MVQTSVMVGNVEIRSISDGTGEFNASDLFPGVTDDAWAHVPGNLTRASNLKTNFGCFVVISQEQVILIDTGVGPAMNGELPGELRKIGVDHDDITIVAFTHLHPDHVGWSITGNENNEQLNFSNATYRVPMGDWNHFTSPGQIENAEHVTSQVVPLDRMGALNLMDGETQLTSEVTFIPTPGHTPGHMSAVIHSEGESGFILGDVVNFPFQVEETTWEIAFDSNPALARKTRETLMDRLEREGGIVGAGHFPSPSFGHVIRSKSRRYWKSL